ncbi:bacteriocin resistance YdeI/OmpD-like protein [Mucilaginibacter yixingensis]|uniref:Bacteriocin resistance YdeI/OmpD-like protein n=1 Tax=Mucilaginibacter yixingensis TaxID=1295612 RepID=A0A2T5JAQ9_9SPHI|nr:YdeI/OmpD-associated family protein [Mucilaginibacter yixingensis]PTQ97953.1 bacteriocin resistance YdeI/OmpD-like protein [Mucilaginibacter yixingensis]
MNALAKKLQMKPGKNWLLYNAPANYLELLEPLPEGLNITFNADGSFDGVQLFVVNSSDLVRDMQLISKVLKADTILWVIYPKKTAGIASDLEMMRNWAEMDQYNLRGVAAAAVSETWTALRFRPNDTGTFSDTCNDAIPSNEYGEYIDIANKQVKLPPDVEAALQHEPEAMNWYASLSYSNRKEYVLWILTAKQEKTRLDRLEKMVEKLKAGKKNPSEK